MIIYGEMHEHLTPQNESFRYSTRARYDIDQPYYSTKPMHPYKTDKRTHSSLSKCIDQTTTFTCFCVPDVSATIFTAGEDKRAAWRDVATQLVPEVQCAHVTLYD